MLRPWLQHQRALGSSLIPPLGALSLHLCSTTLKFDFSWCSGSLYFAFLFGWWQLVRVGGASGALCCHLGEVCFPVIASYFNSIAMVVLDTESAWTCALWKHIDAIICIYEKLSMLSKNVTSTWGFASSLAGKRCSCPSCQVDLHCDQRVVNHRKVQGAVLFSCSPYGDGHYGSHREDDWSVAVSQVIFTWSAGIRT